MNIMAQEVHSARMTGPRILLVVGGGIAAYKSCELVRLIRKGGGEVTCVLTEGGSQFVTPMALAALSENKVYTSLFDLKDEVEMGHIQLSREADLVVVCPATADLLAKMAAGIADDLATTAILATDKPVMAVPAMNVRMWEHEATQRNVEWLRQAGVHVMQPEEGAMACGEFGPGRLPEPETVWLEIAEALGVDPGDVGASEIADYLEALEPEDEPEADWSDEDEPEVESHGGGYRAGGLSALLASIIPRSTSHRVNDDAVAYDDDNFPQDDTGLPPLPEEGWGEAAPDGEEEPLTEPDMNSPLLARKGSASGAPNMDPGALINKDLEAVPMAASVDPGAVVVADVVADPLDGQPAFELDPEHRPLFGKHVLITAGPTHEPIDPVRYIANRSSGKQGFAIAAAAAALGARVTLVAGPVHLQTPPGVDRVDVESAQEMALAVKKALPADVGIMVAAVADWRSRDVAMAKIKKRSSAPPALLLTENPDILATTAGSSNRPRLLVGFAAETDDLLENAKKKRKNKGADWIVANDVSDDVMGGDENAVHIVSADEIDSWEPMPKRDVALKLMERIADALKD